jgi:hypothetical protein
LYIKARKDKYNNVKGILKAFWVRNGRTFSFPTYKAIVNAVKNAVHPTGIKNLKNSVVFEDILCI